jgi:hypothetical protein
MRFLPEFREDREAAFMAHARACRPVAEALPGTRPVGKMFGVLKFERFFRESAGPGWALVGTLRTRRPGKASLTSSGRPRRWRRSSPGRSTARMRHATRR